jgi:hypothetical protein
MPNNDNVLFSSMTDMFLSWFGAKILSDNDRRIKYAVWRMAQKVGEKTKLSNHVFYVDYDARKLRYTNLEWIIFNTFRNMPVDNENWETLADGVYFAPSAASEVKEKIKHIDVADYFPNRSNWYAQYTERSIGRVIHFLYDCYKISSSDDWQFSWSEADNVGVMSRGPEIKGHYVWAANTDVPIFFFDQLHTNPTIYQNSFIEWLGRRGVRAVPYIDYACKDCGGAVDDTSKTSRYGVDHETGNVTHTRYCPFCDDERFITTRSDGTMLASTMREVMTVDAYLASCDAAEEREALYAEMQQHFDDESHKSAINKSALDYNLEWLYKWHPNLVGIDRVFMEWLSTYQKISLAEYILSIVDKVDFVPQAYSCLCTLAECVADKDWVAGQFNGHHKELGVVYGYRSIPDESLDVHVLRPETGFVRPDTVSREVTAFAVFCECANSFSCPIYITLAEYARQQKEHGEVHECPLCGSTTTNFELNGEYVEKLADKQVEGGDAATEAEAM